MKVDSLLLRELLFMEPLVRYQLLNGVITNEISISELVCFDSNVASKDVNKAARKDVQLAEKSMLVLELDNSSLLDTIDTLKQESMHRNILEDNIKALCLLHENNIAIPEIVYQAIKQVHIPVIFLEKLTFEQLLSYYQFAKQLKESGMLLEYIRASNNYLYSLLNKHGISYLWSFLEQTIQQSIFLFNSRLEPLALTDSMVDEIAAKKEEWTELRSAFQMYKGTKQEHIELTAKSAATGKTKNWKLLNIEIDMQQGYVGILEENGQLQAVDVAHVQRALPLIVAELLKQREITETKKSYKQSFLYDLLHNNLEEASDLVISQGKLWDWDLTKPYQLLLIEFSRQNITKLNHEEYKHTQLLIKNLLASSFKVAIVEELNGQIVVMYSDSIGIAKVRKQRKESALAIAETIQEKIRNVFPESKVTVGIGRFYPTTDDLCRAYQEAKTAVELSKYMPDVHIMHFEDLGVMRLLTNIRNEQLEDFFKEYLEELLMFDEENNTNFLQSLNVYFTENGNLKAAAKKLYVHTNTLRYRLKKAEEILKVDLQKPGDFVNLYVASLIHNLNQNK
ncbi:PucR family transcriptional regulator [Desulfuribacillus alkaliarsenatis]|uniref:PucR family transcriptional regulator n=1 Tax=Desulfuribacillus alkaliarsenatis TaxID=766136 RepID=A0A1E5FZ64_9FIRM|nr:helix-turn-helix domain-containing protein [Desulfuribacillus alkaliarsenatis]OEF95829.1 hypothetical protein BHF68_10555 [Desulfuribacillus alkaliarsenatis]